MFRVNLVKPTDELFLSNVLTQNAITRHIFKGFFSINERVAKPTTLPAAYIYNVLPSTSREIGHWVAIFISPDWRIEYFDSYGIRPPEKLFKMMKRWSSKIIWNRKRFQNYNSNVCGLYILYYIYFKCFGWSLQEIQQHFTTHSINNDKFVTDAIKSMIQFF